MIIRYNHPKSKSDSKIYAPHGLLFKDLVRNYFGQTETTHQIGTIIYDNEENKFDKHFDKKEIKVGDMAAFIENNSIKKGIIINILIKNVGVEFLDGKSFLVNYDVLHKILPDDNDYEKLLELKHDISEKLKLYQTIKIGDIVNFKYGNDNSINKGRLEKINNNSLKLSIFSNGTTYTIVYTHLISNTKEDYSETKVIIQEPKAKNFSIGDKVIIAGGPRSLPIYGTVIKLNRVNVRIQSDAGNIWDARYEIVSLQ